MCCVKTQAAIGALSVDAIGEEDKGSLAFRLGNWSCMTGMGGVHGDCVQDNVLESASTWATATDFTELFRSFAKCLKDAIGIGSWSTTLASRARSLNVAFFCELQYERAL